MADGGSGEKIEGGTHGSRPRAKIVMKRKMSIIFALATMVLLLIASCTRVEAPGSSSSEPERPDESSEAVHVPNFDVSSQEDVEEAKELKVTCLPQGYAILQSCNQAMLMDGCAAEDVEAVAQALTDLGVEHLQYIVIPNTSEERYGGVPALMEQFHTALVFVPRDATGDDAYNEFVNNSGLAIVPVGAGSSFNVGNCPVEVVAPVMGEGVAANDASMILKVTCGNNSVLFPNDASTPELEALMSGSADVKANMVFLDGRGGEDVPYGVMRLIAPAEIVTTNEHVTGGGYAASVRQLTDEPLSVLLDGSKLNVE